MNEKKITFELTSGFDYAFKSEQRTATFIELNAPTMKVHGLLSDLTQSVYGAIMDAAEKHAEELRKAGVKPVEQETKEKEDTSSSGLGLEMTSDEVVKTIYVSESVKSNVIWLQASALLTSGKIALIDGEQKLTRALIESMSINDFENMVGEYIANFIVA
jgi:hypothetical protein